MKLATEKRGGWYYTPQMSVSGVAGPGYIKPTSIWLEQRSPLEGRRMVCSFSYLLSNSKTPPMNVSAAKQLLGSDGCGQFVVFVPDNVRTIAQIEGYMGVMLTNLFATGQLLAPTVAEMDKLDRGKTPTRHVFNIEYKQSPTGLLTVWDVAHKEEYTLSEEGAGLEIVSSASEYRCGWGTLTALPQASYTYPDGVKYYLQHEYSSWPKMLSELHADAISSGHVFDAEQYRRAFQ